MNDNRIELIETYLNGDMPSNEKLLFEKEVAEDETLRDLLNMYRTIDAEMYNSEKYSNHENALKSTLQNLNGKYFASAAPVVQLPSRNNFLRIAMSAAAGLLLILAGYFMFFQTSSTTQLADKYVKEELTHLSLTMDGARDSIQLGMSAYNDKDYPKALQLFQAVYQNHPENSDALKYTGLTYLLTKDYDSALKAFDALAGKKELFSNEGLFLKAVTLLQRNQDGDKEQAKAVLEQVINEKAEGSVKAEEWLKKY